MQLKQIVTEFVGQDLDLGPIEQIQANVWNIDDAYILKKGDNLDEIYKSAMLAEILLSMDVPVAGYVRTKSGLLTVESDDAYFCLQQKLRGTHLDPFLGYPQANGRLLGDCIARLHVALFKLQDQIRCYDSDFFAELDQWMLEELEQKKMAVSKEILDYCLANKPMYAALPRQLIHRDLHLGNLLFEDGQLTGYLDFDISQKNVRVFDLCYMGASLLVGHYQDEEKLSVWRTIFEGALQGYARLNRLAADEKMAIPFIMIVIEITFAAFFAKSGHIQAAHDCMAMTEWLYQHQHEVS